MIKYDLFINNIFLIFNLNTTTIFKETFPPEVSRKPSWKLGWTDHRGHA